MNNGLHVSTADMNKNGKDTVASSEEFASELSSLRANVDGLMSIWNGIAANEFNKTYEEQATNLQAFQQLLNELGEAIQHGANILNKTEEENASAGAHLF